MGSKEGKDKKLDKVLYQNKGRLKELACINQTNQILKEGKSLDETLHRICLILPLAWQYSEFAEAQISFNDKVFKTSDFNSTEWRITQKFETINKHQGKIEICYKKKFQDADEGPFLKEERDLINNLAHILENHINTVEAKEFLKDSIQRSSILSELEEDKTQLISPKKLLQNYLNKHNANKDIFHDLMPFKVKEILLVATLYDAFSIEKEGRIMENILGEYHQLNLTSMPRITGVSNEKEALDELRNKHFDLIILMGGDLHRQVTIAKKIKVHYNYIPVYWLLNNDLELNAIKDKNAKPVFFDRVFVWNGDSKIFFAMVKQLEDRINLENDTRVGLVKVILLVEDSEKYYSRYLPLLYTVVMQQTKRLIDDVSTDDQFKVLKLRARPKIILATNYEEAIEIFNRLKEHLLCVISDVKFEKEGVLDERAGFQLIQEIKNELPELPAIVQSSDPLNASKVGSLKAVFFNKNSESLLLDVKSFLNQYLGFGDFLFTDDGGRVLAVADSLKEFEKQIALVPAGSLYYHGRRNHFSLWMIARGEIRIARMIHPVNVNDFSDVVDFRRYLLNAIKKYKNEVNTGRIINYEESAILDETNIVSLGSGSLGGKGRGLTFINSIIYNLNFKQLVSGINIRTPITLIIGTDEFDRFLDDNGLRSIIYSDIEYTKLRKKILQAKLSVELQEKIKAVVKLINGPMAFRSSSLFEDSTLQPFSGIFDTYLLPNNSPDIKERHKRALNAIKMVYASIFSDTSRKYFEAVGHKIDEEKMAIIIQQVVGSGHEGYFYPHISGTAQSYNYYPVANMKPEEGCVVAGLGLGKYIVEGERAHRFSPRYPKVDVSSIKDMLQNSQVDFLAIDMHQKQLDLLEHGEDAALVRLPVSESEKHGTLNHLVSVYSANNDRLEPGLSGSGPRIIDFSNILKYDYIPLAKSLEVVLDVFKETVGGPVELEFAVDLNRDEVNNQPSLYLLQMKPVFGRSEEVLFDLGSIKKEKILLYAEKSMGNGKIENIYDLVYVDRQAFDRTKTMEIVKEIEKLNEEMVNASQKYILIGPGRWGTRDKFIGVPVNWTQISNAKVIVEIGLSDFPLDASLGSHFFHNVTSMNVGYFSIQHSSHSSFIAWDFIEKQKIKKAGEYIRHITFKKPVTVLMDGKQRNSVIYFQHE